MFDKIHEECGVFGIYDNDGHDVASATYYALFALQHRGQESLERTPLWQVALKVKTSFCNTELVAMAVVWDNPLCP